MDLITSIDIRKARFCWKN